MAASTRELFGAALAAGLALTLTSLAPADAGTFRPHQLGIEEQNTISLLAARTHRKPVREARRREHKSRHVAKRKETPPRGPYQIVVSIAKQQVTLYGQDGAIARGPVSTGVPEHPTPKGIFSVISKSRWHRSNIYSGAPMPYMQRITWSGIAMHEGPLPGHPASHGCIRLTHDFAVRLWGLTKVGTRVIVTDAPAAPVKIAHAKLFVPKKPEEKPVLVADAKTTASISIDAQTPYAGAPAAATESEETRGMIAALAPLAPAGEGPVSVFVSLKQKRVFARQGFVALFDMPAEIAEPDRPIGTHVYTAMALTDDGKAMRWTVTSVPSGYRHQRRKKHGEPAAPSSAAGALDRITLPPEAVERISALMMPGSSLIVSDNALSDETNEYSEFIVLTR